MGNTKSDEELYVYLYLTNYNDNNSLNETYTRPSSGSRFKMVDAAKSDKQRLGFERKVRLAGSQIDKMDDTRLRVVAKGLSLKNIGKYTDVDTIRMRLIDLSKKSEWVDRILKLDDDVAIEIIAIIKDAEDANLIYSDTIAARWIWTDTKDKICGIVPGKSPEIALKDFFISEAGSESLDMIQAQLASDPIEEDSALIEEQDPVEELED